MQPAANVTPQGPVAPPPKTPFESQWEELDRSIKNLTLCFQGHMTLTMSQGGFKRWIPNFQRNLLYADYVTNELLIQGNRWCLLAKAEKQETVQAYKVTLRNNYIAFTKEIIDGNHEDLEKLDNYYGKNQSANHQITFEVMMKEVSAAEKAMNVFAQLIVKVDSLKTK